ncbi:MAG: methylglyoxal synthase [Ardenticatenaceae bacterium]|nr:methylglyoxal synthase [Ardenticatenaceae bacterium]HBY92943.1 methylglyoxal synthase [Chloroflexota bacterium]
MGHKKIALIAHDRKKLDLAFFVRDNLDIFRHEQLVATASTGQTLKEKTGLEVELVAHGPEGGDLMIGAMIAAGQVEAVIFFRDPLTAQPHEPDVSALLRVCDVHNVPLATNLGTATAIVDWLEDRNVESSARNNG